MLERYYGYYQQAIRDALHRSCRKPFQYGGLRGHDQMTAISQHLAQQIEQGRNDPYLSQLGTPIVRGG